jgi:hypothetical protein
MPVNSDVSRMGTLDLLICRGIKRLQVMFLAECIYKTLTLGYLP